MSNPSESTELERINSILWPHPFSGEYAKPYQIAISNGLPPEGKAFVMSYSLAVKAIQHLLAQEYSRGRRDELESLNHEPQMHGDWQKVIDDRLAELEKGQEDGGE